MAEWVPDPNGVAQVLELAKLARDPARRQEVIERLTEYNQIADFNKYLCYAFAFLSSEDGQVRMMIAIVLKDNVARYWKKMDPEVQHYIMTHAPLVLEDPLPPLREICGSLITVIFAQTTVQGWPDLVENLVAVLDNENVNLVYGALGTLSKLCEDHGRALCQVHDDLPQQPIDILLPKLYQLLSSGKPDLIDLALKCIVHVVPWQPPAFLLSVNDFFAFLFELAQNPPSASVLVTVCRTFDALVFGRVTAIADHMESVVQYMLEMTNSTDTQVALAASGFWSTIADTEMCYNALLPYLQQVVETLLRGMRFSEDELDQMPDVEEDVANPDRPETSNPALGRIVMGEAVEATFDTSMSVSEWTVRKACGRGLDELTNVFGEDILDIIIPMCLAGLQSENWLDREASILALGATSSAFLHFGDTHLPGLVNQLLQLLEDTRPLIRHTTAWSISQYASWIAKNGEILQTSIHALLRRLTDRSKPVVEWALQSLAIISDAATTNMRDFLEDLMPIYMQLQGWFQGRLLIRVLDAIGSLAYAVGEALAQSHILEMVMPPIMARWEQVDQYDERVAAAMFDCLARISAALGASFAPWVVTVWDYGVRVIQEYVMACALYKTSPESMDEPATKIPSIAIELVATIVEGMKASTIDLISESNLISLLVELLRDPVTDIIRASMCLAGDIAANGCFPLLEPALDPIVESVIAHVRPRVYHVSITTNAAWALREILDRAADRMAHYAVEITRRCVNLLHDTNLHSDLHHNAAILLGSAANAYPEVVAEDLRNFVGSWCVVLADLDEDEDVNDKEMSFFGLLSAVRVNPEAVLPDFNRFAYAIASWGAPENALRQAFIDILEAYQQQLGPDIWDQVCKTIDGTSLAVLQQWYM